MANFTEDFVKLAKLVRSNAGEAETVEGTKIYNHNELTLIAPPKDDTESELTLGLALFGLDVTVNASGSVFVVDDSEDTVESFEFDEGDLKQGVYDSIALRAEILSKTGV